MGRRKPRSGKPRRAPSAVGNPSDDFILKALKALEIDYEHVRHMETERYWLFNIYMTIIGIVLSGIFASKKKYDPLMIGITFIFLGLLGMAFFTAITKLNIEVRNYMTAIRNAAADLGLTIIREKKAGGKSTKVDVDVEKYYLAVPLRTPEELRLKRSKKLLPGIGNVMQWATFMIALALLIAGITQVKSPLTILAIIAPILCIIVWYFYQKLADEAISKRKKYQ